MYPGGPNSPTLFSGRFDLGKSLFDKRMTYDRQTGDPVGQQLLHTFDVLTNLWLYC